MKRQDTTPGGELAALDQRRTVTAPLRHAQGLRVLRFAATLSVVVLLAGCAAIQQNVGGWFGVTTPTPTPQVTTAAPAARHVYYAGVEALKVYSEPSTSAKVVGQLSLHEKVTRSKLERGYAYVEGDKSGAKGWVNNAQLLWRLPGAPTTTAPAPAEPESEEPEAPAAEEPQAPAAPEATATAAEAVPTNTPVPAAPPSAKGTPRGVAPSIFDPY